MNRSRIVALVVALLFLVGCFLPTRPVPHCWETAGPADASYED